MAKIKIKSKKKDATDVWYVLIAVFVGFCLLAGLLVAIFKPTGLWDSISLHTNTAMKSEHYSINNAQFQYTVYSIYNNYYQQYYSTYGSTSMSYFGFDRTLPLSEQKYFNSSTTSWLDACVSDAKSSLTQILYLCEAARAEGITLSEESKKSVTENVDAIADFAKEYNYSFATYVGNLYGSKGITRGDIKGILELQALASQYTTKAYDEFTYTDEQYNAYYDEHKLDYLKADYYTYQIKATYASDADDAAKTEAVSAAKTKAQELLDKIDGGMSFIQVIVEYEQELAQAEIDALGEDATDEEKTAAQEKYDAITPESVKKKIEVKAHKNSDSELDQWLFADTPAADGSSHQIQGEETVDIYQVTQSAYRDDYKTITMGQLFLSLDQFSSPADVIAEAEKMISDFNAGSDKSYEAFEALKDKYTTETVTVSSGGKSKEVTKAGTEEYEEIDEWLFSEERAHGDVKYFEFENQGVSIYYFDEFGRPAWNVLVNADMEDEDYKKLCEELAEKYAVTTNDKAIAKIN